MILCRHDDGLLQRDPRQPLRMRLETVPELFPLTGEEMSEDVVEFFCLICLRQPASEHRQDSRVPEPTCTLRIEIGPDR